MSGIRTVARRSWLALLTCTVLCGPARGYAEEPEPWRTQVAEALAVETGSAEEAHDALRNAWQDGSTSARHALLTLCIREDPRPGWIATYQGLAAAPGISRADADRLRRRAAQAMTWVPGSQARARDELRARLSRSPEDLGLQFHLARAYMVTGQPAAALPLFSRHVERPEFALGVRLARLALAEGELASRAAEVASGGYPELAAWMVERADPRHADPAAWLVRGEGWASRGRLAEAVADFRSALVVHPGDDALRVALTRALLAQDDVVAAAEAASGSESALALVRGVQARDVAPEVALALAPNEPAVLRAGAERALAAGRGGDALALLSSLDEARMNEATRDTYARAAIAAGRPDLALAAWRSAVVRASGPERRASLADRLAVLHGWIAEHAKARGDAEGAERSRRVVVTMRPAWGWAWAGLGGAAWQAGHLDVAKAAYLVALAYEAGSGGEAWRSAAIELSLQQGDLAGAEALTGWRAAPGSAGFRLQRRVAAVRAAAQLEALEPAERTRALVTLSARDPEDAELARVVAQELSELSRPVEAAAAWKRASLLLPDDADLRLGEAAALAAAGQREAAEASLAEAARLGASEDALGRTRGAVLRATGDRLWLGEGRRDEALEVYTEALRLHPDPWTHVALAGLHLVNGQAWSALEHYEAALARDPANVVAAQGRIRALGALGRWSEARSAAATAPELARALVEAEQGEALGAIDRARRVGDLATARDRLADASARWPDAAVVHAAASRVALSAGAGPEALREARRAVALAPGDRGALGALVDAAEAAEAWAEVDAALHEAGQSAPVAAQAARDELRFRASLLGALRLVGRGDVSGGDAQLRALAERAAGDPDRETRLGGAWLSLGRYDRAMAAYDRALQLHPGLPAAVLGRAGVLTAQGRVYEARRWLAEQYAASPDPEVGVRLAWLEGRTGGAEMIGGLSHVPVAGLGPGVGPTAAGVGEAVPLEPSVAELANPGRSATQASRSVAQLERSRAARATFGVLAGALGNSGTEGEGLLAAGVGGVYGAWPVWGPIDVTGSATLLRLDDGTAEAAAAAPAVGLRSLPEARLSGTLWLGTTPLGTAAEATPTALVSGRYRILPSVQLGADLGRLPMTESVTSWAGDPLTGATGRTTYISAGATLAWRSATALDAGVRGRAGYLEGISLPPVARQEVGAWGGRTFGVGRRWLRVGLNGTGLFHGEEVGGYGSGEAAVFTPSAYGLGLASADGLLAAGEAVRICGGTHLGVEVVAEGAATRLAPGVHASYGARLGLAADLGSRWGAGVTGQFDAVTGWNQRAAAAWISYGPEGGRAVGLPAIHGDSVAGMAGCL